MKTAEDIRDQLQLELIEREMETNEEKLRRLNERQALIDRIESKVDLVLKKKKQNN